MAKVALITGITGQDGSFLAEFLIENMKYTALCAGLPLLTPDGLNTFTWMNGCAI